MKTFDKSRNVTIVDVPDVNEIYAKFVYNFFVPDERYNKSGQQFLRGSYTNKNTQRLVNTKTQRNLLPRYVQVDFGQGKPITFGTLKKDNNNFSTNLVTIQDFGNRNEFLMREDEITNNSFQTLHESDFSAKERIGQKVKSLSDILSLDFSESDQSKKISNFLNCERDVIQSLLNPYNDTLTLTVNESIEEKENDLFSNSVSVYLSTLVNKRFFDKLCANNDDISSLSKSTTKQMIDKVTKDFLSKNSSKEVKKSDMTPTFKPFDVRDLNNTAEVGIKGIASVGYLINKTDYSENKKSEILILDATKTNFIDPEILYGTKYSYSVCAIYRVDAIIEDTQESTTQKKFISILVASKPSKEVTVITQEFNPPIEPDGVFYRYDHMNGGLIITWQMSSGKTRDVKYFQVFKRKNINEPFTCIAEIDFNDSYGDDEKNEKVRDDLVLKYPGATTFFIDKSYTRESPNTVYAICAIDAHGLTSGYSTQTEVSFDKFKNNIKTKEICRAGCPKQYPNFFVDPRQDENVTVDSFSQDALYDSGHKKIDVYFTPDLSVFTNTSGKKSFAISTNQNNGNYKINMINLDLQKSNTTTLSVDNLQNS
jgi:hypothetical protein